MRNAITIRAALIVPLLLTAGVLVAGNPPSQHEARITGTYTNMYFNKEGGDLLGEELRIVAVSGNVSGCARGTSEPDSCRYQDRWPQCHILVAPWLPSIRNFRRHVTERNH